MSNFFSYFPTTEHDLTSGGNTITLTDLLKRFKFRSKVLARTEAFRDYAIVNNDRPDIVSYKLYGNSNYAWVVLLVNDIIDPMFQWPLSEMDFRSFIVKKYGTVTAAKSTIHEYRQIHRDKTVFFDGTIDKGEYFVVDLATYNGLSTSVRESITKYDYEDELNEERRQIRILEERYLIQLLDEAKLLLKVER